MIEELEKNNEVNKRIYFFYIINKVLEIKFSVDLREVCIIINTK